MKTVKTVSIILILFIITLSSIGYSEEKVDEIIKKANLASYYAGKDGSARVSMTITDKAGREMKREFSILRLDIKDGGDQKFYVYFKRPSDVRKMSYMVWKHLNSDDDRWMYLPALDLVNRIEASDKRSSFVGSHFTYEDVSGRNPSNDKHELMGEDETSFTIKSTPKDLSSVEFSYFIVKIDKKTYLPKSADYFNKVNKKYRTVEAIEIKTIKGYPTVTRAKVSDLLTGGHTISEFSSIKYDIGIKEKIFTERYLKRAPKKWLK